MNILREYAVAMTNCDYSGLLEGEEEKLKDFPDFNVIDWGTDFKRCNICGLHGDTVEIEIK